MRDISGAGRLKTLVLSPARRRTLSQSRRCASTERAAGKTRKTFQFFRSHILRCGFVCREPGRFDALPMSFWPAMPLDLYPSRQRRDPLGVCYARALRDIQSSASGPGSTGDGAAVAGQRKLGAASLQSAQQQGAIQSFDKPAGFIKLHTLEAGQGVGSRLAFQAGEDQRQQCPVVTSQRR